MSNAQMIFTLLNVMYKVQVGVNGSLENAYDTFVIVSPNTNYPRSEQKAFPCTIETIDNLICNLYFHLIQRVSIDFLLSMYSGWLFTKYFQTIFSTYNWNFTQKKTWKRYATLNLLPIICQKSCQNFWNIAWGADETNVVATKGTNRRKNTKEKQCLFTFHNPLQSANLPLISMKM